MSTVKDTSHVQADYTLFLNNDSLPETSSTANTIGPLVNDSTERVFYPTQSFFSQHILHKSQFRTYTDLEKNHDWLPGIIIFSLFLLALIRFVYYKKLRIVLLAPFSARHMGQLLREGEAFTPPMRIYLIFNYLIIFSLLIYLAVKILVSGGLMISGFPLFVIIFAVNLVLFNAKLMVISFIGWLFKNPVLSFHYILNIRLFTILQGIMLIPLTLGASFVTGSRNVYFLQAGAVLIILLYLIKIFKGILWGVQDLRFAGVYIFVYLCTLEILPILLLLKLFETIRFA